MESDARHRHLLSGGVSLSRLCQRTRSRRDEPKELGRAVRESVDFKGRHVDKQAAARKLEAARKWLRLPLQDFLREIGISETDEAYEEIVAIWRDFHD